MQYCPKCRVSIKGNKTGCPLCGGRLTGEPEPGGFPVIEKSKISHMSVVKLATFCCLSVFIILMALEVLYNFKLPWVPFVVIIMLIAWGDLMVGVYFRSNFIKMFAIETYLIMVTCLIADLLTGFHGWSVAFVFPIGFLVLVLVTIGVGRGARLRLEEYIIYLAVAMLLSMLQIIPIVLHSNPVILPAVLCMAIMLILACGAIIFRFRDLMSAVEKLFNL